MKPEVLQFIIGLVAASVVLFSILLAREVGVKNRKAINLLYILVAGLCIGILGLTRYLGLLDKPVVFFLVLQAAMLIAGIIHVAVHQKTLQWPSESSFTGEFILTLNAAIVGAVFLLLGFTLTGMKNFEILMLSSIVWFLVPFLFTKAVAFYALIPVRSFKSWSYPVDKPLTDPTDSEMAMPMVISFEFRKKHSDDDDTIFRAKAPKDIQFGRLFYFFINDYNSRHPEGTIEVSSGQSGAYQWVFHFKPTWLAKTRYLDPDETVYHNHIKENSVIVCHRIIEK